MSYPTRSKKSNYNLPHHTTSSYGSRSLGKGNKSSESWRGDNLGGVTLADLGYQVFGEDEVRHEALKRSILDVGLALTKLRLQFLTSISNPDVDKIVQADLAWLNSEEPKLSNGLSD